MQHHDPLTDLDAWRRRYASEMIGDSPALAFAVQVVQRSADTNSTVLIAGESGTGKELLARALHDASPRHAAPFVAVNCAALPENLVESELFGHARGAFTGAASNRAGRIVAAEGGTLFLDEIGDLPLAAQAKLLRALQERAVVPVGSDTPTPFNVRIVAATHRDLEAMVDAGEFRLDLYYRISVIRTELPPLRERPEDILPLAEFFIGRFNEIAGRTVTGLSLDAQRALLHHPWRGNVRELANAMERGVVLTGSGELSLHVLGLAPPRRRAVAAVAGTQSTATSDGLNLKDAVKHVENNLIKRALEQTGGNRTEAAALLGLNRTTLVEKIRKLG